MASNSFKDSLSVKKTFTPEKQKAVAEKFLKAQAETKNKKNGTDHGQKGNHGRTRENTR